MTLGAGRRGFFGLIFFVESSVAAPAVVVQGFGVIFHFHFFLVGLFYLFFTPLLFEVFGHFARFFVALDTPLNRVALL